MTIYLTGCAAQLESLNHSLNSLSEMSYSSSTRSNVDLSSKVVYPKNQELKNKIDSAMPFISDMLTGIACLEKGRLAQNNGALRLYATADSYINRFAAPADGMRYHDRSTCLDVIRIDGWRNSAVNSLKFSATFRSESSGETGARIFTIIKQPNGNWLARF